jgi:chemotaxis protein methyltransferase CheR
MAKVVAERTGLASSGVLAPRMLAAIERFALRRGIVQAAALGRLLDADAEAFDALIADVTVGETYFWRDQAQLELIGRTLLPELAAREGPEHVVRVWSAGCATGEEAYSMAVLLLEAGLAPRAHVLGTDVSRNALRIAERAVYRDWSFRDGGARVRALYARPFGGGHRLVDEVRALTSFRYLNLNVDPYPSIASGVFGLDCILCRNVLIYFAPATVAAVAARLAEALAPGGWLVTAGSDPPLTGVAALEPVVTEAGVLYRRRPAEGCHPLPTAAAMATATIERATAAAASLAAATGAATPLVNEREPEPGPEAPLADAPAAAKERALAARIAAVRSLANRDPALAERECHAALGEHPHSTELLYVHAAILMELGRDAAALQALRALLFLDRKQAAAHLTMASVLRRLGRRDDARRSLRNAAELLEAMPPDAPVPLAEPELAGRLAVAAAAELAMLGA